MNATEEVDARFRTMADCAPVLLWMTGLEGLCEFFNASWLKFTGRSLQEELGNGWAEGVHPEDFQECMHTFMDCFVRREAFAMEYRLRRHDGVYRWILDQGAPRFDEAGSFAGFIGSCVDITTQREAQNALSQSNLDLGRQVIERTTFAREREDLLREVHHRVKNDLQLVASLLRMYGVQVENVEASKVLTLCEERIHAIARVHEQTISLHCRSRRCCKN
jgi:PAS domain S-box-containing protein